MHVCVMETVRYMTCELEAFEYVGDYVFFLDKTTSTFSEHGPMKDFLKEPKSKYVCSDFGHTLVYLSAHSNTMHNRAAKVYLHMARQLSRRGDPSWHFREKFTETPTKQ